MHKKALLFTLVALVVVMAGAALVVRNQFYGSAVHEESDLYVSSRCDYAALRDTLARHIGHRWAFDRYAARLGLGRSFKPGRYLLRPGMNVIEVARMLKLGEQTPVRITFNNVRTPAQLAATLAQFTARYDAHKEDKTAPYPGIPALLDALKAEGIQCAVFSNKADALCGGIIAHYFGTGRFDAVRGNRPGVPTKPDPTGLYALMTELGADPAATLFVGDSDVDILTGHNAQLPAMGALWGFRGRAELTAAGADALAAVPEDIFTYIQKG